MAQGSTEDRTEKPTPKRLKDLRKKNTVWRSNELNQTVGLIAVVVMAPLVIRNMWDAGEQTMRLAFSEAGTLRTTSELLGLTQEVITTFFYAVAAPVGIVLMSVIAAGLILTRGRPNVYAIKPRVELLNPKNGIKRVLGVQGLVEAIKGSVKLIAVAIVSWTVLPTAYAALEEGPASLGDFMGIVGRYAWQLTWRLVAVGVVVAAFDLWWTRRTYFKQAKMSKSDVRREYKSSEGDPMVKAARRQRAMQLARQRMMDEVPTATVVLTNPTHLSIALRYTASDVAPVVVARGAGVIAMKIRERAREAGIPVQENKPLARSLYRACRPGDTIPVELYAAVAAVLAAVMRKTRRKVSA